jgi:uncharacterized protein with HEPN domain
MRDDKTRLQDILDAIEVIDNYLLDRKIYELNEVEFAGILRYLEVIGEASHSVSQTLKDKYSQLPWRIIKDLRNVLAHQYFNVDVKIIENTINTELPLLKSNVIKMLGEFN